VDRSSISPRKSGKSREAFRTISEVAESLDLPQHVLRFWESKFSQIKPLKRGGNRRYYRPDDVTLLTAVKKLLHSDGYTIRGVQKLFKAQGVRATIVLALDEPGTESLAIGVDNEQRVAELPESTISAAGEEQAACSPSKPALKNLLVQLIAIRDRLN